MFPSFISLGQIIYKADVKTRHEMILGGVHHTERSYCEAVFTRVRDSFLKKVNRFSVTAQTLDTQAGDGILVFRYKNFLKIALIEAKLVHPGGFDYIQNGTSQSHFTTQIIKQGSWSNNFACFELFILKLPIGQDSPPLDRDGSSCAWRSTALQHIQGRPRTPVLWKMSDLIGTNHLRLCNLEDIVNDILSCSEGRGLNYLPADGFIEVLDNAGTRTMKVPIPDLFWGTRTRNRVDNFLKEFGFGFYEYFNFSSIESEADIVKGDS